MRKISSAFSLPAMALIATISVATAGEQSTLNVLGFSQDGAIFAFEEYGIQDGSGFPYANRYYIDTVNDEYMASSPIRMREDDENASLESVRAQAKQQGAGTINDTQLQPGYWAGGNAITELSADAYRLAVNPRPVEPPIDQPVDLRLVEKVFSAGSTCSSFQDTSIGFELIWAGVVSGQRAIVLHDEDAVPSSRGCPLGYRLGHVYTYHPEGGVPVMAIMIAVRSRGFEGPDYRWMAVTAPLEAEAP